MYYLFTDGSGNPSTRRCGWGFVLQTPIGEVKGCGFEDTLSTNKMELLAVIKGLEQLPKDKCCKVRVYTDSLYVLMGRFKRAESKQKLWSFLKQYTSQHDIEFVKIGSGNRHPIHKEAHNLAREAVFNGLSLGDYSACCS